MSCPSIVRVARPEDHRELWRLFLGGHKENGMFSLSPQKVEWFIQRALHPDMIPEWDTGVRGVIGVIGDIGSLEAVAFVNLGCFWYTEDRHVEEYMVYVDPECRKSFHAKALISWMKEQSQKTRLPLLSGIISSDRTEAKVRLYERMMPNVGAFFLYQPENIVRVSSASFAA